jgi:hypothetical protein
MRPFRKIGPEANGSEIGFHGLTAPSVRRGGERGDCQQEQLTFHVYSHVNSWTYSHHKENGRPPATISASQGFSAHNREALLTDSFQNLNASSMLLKMSRQRTL